MSAALLLVTLLIKLSSTLPLNSPLLQVYDYIIVGGGPAGLTVANRLSEDPNVNVLLLEAGPADQGELDIEIPAFIGEDIGGRYDWNLSTVPQIYLDGQPRSIPQGRVLGGGTVLNGMLWNRGGVGDYADWEELGNPGWSWNDLLPYFMRSETFTPVYSPEIAEQFSIQEYPSVHGYSGPVNVSFPKYFWNSSAVLFDALNEAGVPTSYDPNTGWIAGASFLPMDVDPVTEERCTARRAYYDPYVDRPNLWVSTGQTVTQVLFGNREVNPYASTPIPGDTSVGQGYSPGMPTGIFGGTITLNIDGTLYVTRPPQKRGLLDWIGRKLKRKFTKRQYSNDNEDIIAVGVEFASESQGARQYVAARREVIVAAGAIHSPKLLMASGIGPATALDQLDIPVNVNLPGVGSNLQDHGQVWCWYPFYNASLPNPTMLTHNATFAGDAWIEYWTSRTGPLTAGAIDGVAFPALPYVVNGSTAIAEVAAAQSPEQYLPSGVDSRVLSGYARQHALMTDALTDITRAAYEIINANDGVLTVANMRPFSRGTVTLNTPYAFFSPSIDPRYGSNPVDTQVLQAAMSFNQRLMDTNSLSQMDPVQMYPSADATDQEVVQYIHSRWQTEYHPAGTCAMMPLDLGGVVSPELLVYGTQNLRVVDSSAMPMIPAAHLQAVVYGVAEKAADIIKAVHQGDTTTQRTTPEAARSVSSDAASTTVDPPPSTTFVTVVYTQTVYGS